MLNAAVAETLDEMVAAITSKVKDGIDFKQAVIEVVREGIIASKPVRFEGNGYGEEWVEEAERRGLLNLKKTPEALAELVKPDALNFLAKAGVFSHEEAEAQYHVRIERYIKDVEIEIETLKEIVQTLVLPAAYKHQNLLSSSLENLKDVLGEIPPRQVSELKDLSKTIAALHTSLDTLAEKVGAGDEIESLEAKARNMADVILPAMLDVRALADKLEEVVADELWPLPKYREMLFLS
jgi:glutamine synthetase